MADGPGDDEVGPGRRGGVEKGFMDRPALPRDVLELGLEAVADQVMRSLDPGLAHPKLFVIGHAGDDGFAACRQDRDGLLHRVRRNMGAVPGDQSAARQADSALARQDDQRSARVEQGCMGQQAFAHEGTGLTRKNAKVSDLQVIGEHVADPVGKAAAVDDRDGDPCPIGKRGNDRAQGGKACLLTGGLHFRTQHINRKGQKHDTSLEFTGPIKGKRQAGRAGLDIRRLGIRDN